MNLGAAIGTACAAFAATNVDDIFVLVTFFAESATNRRLTPLTILLGQYAGFTVIMALSLVGFAVSLALPPEPIGFLGFLPLLLGLWNLFDVLISRDAGGDASETELPMTTSTWFRSILKVGSITLINGGDNISSYIPLFAQAKRAEIAVYVVVFYIMLGLWYIVGWLAMKQKHVLLVAQKHTKKFIPFLYMGLGVFVIVKSHCYPWSIERIDKNIAAHPGRLVLALSTTGFLLLCMGLMFWIKWRKRSHFAIEALEDDDTEAAAEEGGRVSPNKQINHSSVVSGLENGNGAAGAAA